MALALAGLVLAALFLRVWGVGWSLPYVDHPDEPAVVNVVLRILRGNPNPEHFFYPALMLYLQAAVLQLHFWFGLQMGLYDAPLTLPESTHFYTTIPSAFVWARLCTALLSTATVAALAAWGQRYAGRWAAFVGAGLLALSPWAIIHAHYITVDAPAAFFALLAVLAAWQVLHHPTWRTYLLAALLIGLATGTKYQNVLVVVPLLLAHALRWRGGMLRHSARLLAAGLVAALIFFGTSPYIILDFAGFRATMETLFSSYDGSHGDVGRAWPLDAYLWFHWHEGLGAVPFLLALVGAVALLRRSLPDALVLLSFPLLLIATLLPMETHFYRNLLPAQPPLMLLAGMGAVALYDASMAAAARARLRSPTLKPAAAAAGLALLLVWALPPALQSSARLAQPDSRVVAQEWARQTWPGVRIATEQSHPMRWGGVAQATYVHYLPLRPMAWYRSQGYGLLMANEGKRKREHWTEDYAPLLAAGRVVATFGGQGSGYLGPRIDIIETGLTPATLPAREHRVALGPLQLAEVRSGRLVQQTTGTEMQPHAALAPGDVLAVHAFWMVEQPVPPAPYMTFLHLRDEQNTTVAQRDAPPWNGLFPPQQWPQHRPVVESMHLALPDSLAAGEYRLVMGLYESSSGARFAAYADGQRLAHDEVDLGTIVVTP